MPIFIVTSFGNHPETWTLKRGTPLSKAKILPVIHNNLEMMQDSKIACKLALFANRKLHMGSLLVPKLVTLTLEWPWKVQWPLFCIISQNSVGLGDNSVKPLKAIPNFYQYYMQQKCSRKNLVFGSNDC